MKQKIIACLIAAVFTISIANAGDSAKNVTEDPIAVDNSIGATLSAGYMSHYVFYGVDLAEHGIWTGIDYTLDALPIPIDVGVWYINGADGSGYDELDLYAGVAGPTVAGIDTYVTFLSYISPQDAFDTQYELNLGFSRSLGPIDWNGQVLYDFELEGWYWETGLSKNVTVSDGIEVVVSTGIAYQNDYNSGGNAWNHVYVQLALPIALSDTATLEPYVAGLFALDAIDDFQDDLLHGGVSLSVTF